MLPYLVIDTFLPYSSHASGRAQVAMLANSPSVYTVACILYNDRLRMMIGNDNHDLPRVQKAA